MMQDVFFYTPTIRLPSVGSVSSFAYAENLKFTELLKEETQIYLFDIMVPLLHQKRN